MTEWFIHRFECSECEVIMHADRCVDCWNCGGEMEHAEKVAEIDI